MVEAQPESLSDKAPGWGRSVGLATSNGRMLRVVSCRSRTHPCPLSERPGRGGRIAADHLCFSFQTRTLLGQMLGREPGLMRYGLSINGLAPILWRKLTPPTSLGNG